MDNHCFIGDGNKGGVGDWKVGLDGGLMLQLLEFVDVLGDALSGLPQPHNVHRDEDDIDIVHASRC